LNYTRWNHVKPCHNFAFQSPQIAKNAEFLGPRRLQSELETFSDLGWTEWNSETFSATLDKHWETFGDASWAPLVFCFRKFILGVFEPETWQEFRCFVWNDGLDPVGKYLGDHRHYATASRTVSGRSCKAQLWGPLRPRRSKLKLLGIATWRCVLDWQALLPGPVAQF